VRAARIDDHRRHLREKRDRWKLKLQRFAFEGIPSLGREELSFSSPLTVICGPNGVGKTTLLRAIKATAKPSASADDKISAHKLPSGTATLDFLENDKIKSSTVTFVGGRIEGGNSVDVEVVHLDVASALPELQREFCSFESASDITNGEGARLLSAKDVDTLNYLARKDYKSVKLYEVDAGKEDVVPYFEIELGDSSYDSRTMGSGEFAIFYLWWALARAALNALILIEEPECHLSPGSQASFCDFLLRMTVERTLTIIMATHSAKIVSRLDNESLIFLYRGDKGVQIVRGQPSTTLLETVGIETVVDSVVFAEDQAGVQFGRFLLQTFRPDLARRTEFVDRRGDGNITTALKASSQVSKITMLGFYDGDVRSAVPAEVAHQASFLPGDEPIEKALRKMLEQDIERMKVALDRPDLDQVLFALKGHDHHEWYHGLCLSLGQTSEQLYPTLFRIWLRQAGNEAIGKAAVEDLAAKYNPLP
jgi:predicted ATPase